MVARTRITLEGTVGGGQDTWTSSFHLGASGGYTLAQLQTAADAIDTLWQGNVWLGTGDGILTTFPPATTYSGLTLRDINAAGITERVVTAGPVNPILGTSDFGSMPTECSVVVSLLTTTAGGRGRGRMYLPPMSYTVLDSPGTLLASVAADIVESMKDFFNAVNASADVPDDVSIYSTAAGVLREVDSIRVGNVIDSQRRRRNTIVESYTGQSITH